MLKSVGFLIAGTIISFIINHFLFAGFSWQVDLFHSFAFGLGWAMAYFLDRFDFSLAKKLGISFVGIFVLLGIGFAFFDFQAAVPSVIRFSVVFVAYYLLASFRSSKSLRKQKRLILIYIKNKPSIKEKNMLYEKVTFPYLKFVILYIKNIFFANLRLIQNKSK